MAKQKKWKKKIIKVKVPTSFCLTGQQNDAFQNRPRLKLCSVRNLKRICARVRTWSRFLFDQIVFLQMTKLTLSEHWTLWGVVLEVPRGCCCTAEFSSSSIGAVVPRRCFEKRAVLISREGPSDGAKRMVMMSPRHHPSVLPLWFLIPRIVLMFVHPRDVLKPGRWFCLLSLAFMRAPICARPRFCN